MIRLELIDFLSDCHDLNKTSRKRPVLKENKVSKEFFFPCKRQYSEYLFFLDFEQGFRDLATNHVEGQALKSC